MTVTRAYEALVILKAAGTEQEIARQASRLEELIKKAGGRVEGAQVMGRRRLAFRIARQSEGYYHLFRFQAPTERVGELERAFRLNDAIVRFMIVSAEDAPAPVAQARG
jgi:small subunit ribosomal protein S6